MALMPSIEGIRDASEMLKPYIQESALIHSPEISHLLGADVWLKNEAVPPIFSFKLRGALTTILREKEGSSITAAVTSSTGNHGLGVSYAAHLLNLPSHIFLPRHSNLGKHIAIKNTGAHIHEVEGDIDDAKVSARNFSTSYGYTFVDDGEGMGVMEGAGTIGLEIAESLTEIDQVFIPVGSGALAGGSAAAIKSIQHRARIIGVQAKGAPAMIESLRAGRPISCPINTIADGLVCRVPAELALRGLLSFVDDGDLVSDAELLAAVHSIANLAHILVEPSGAAAFASAWSRRRELKGKRIVLVLTGANITMETLRLALSSPAPYIHNPEPSHKSSGI